MSYAWGVNDQSALFAFGTDVGFGQPAEPERGFRLHLPKRFHAGAVVLSVGSVGAVDQRCAKLVGTGLSSYARDA